MTLDNNETVVSTYTYTAFGNTTANDSIGNPFRYVGAQGYYQDFSDSGLMLLGARYYDPSMGRFMTLDPIKDGENWYGYVGDNPVLDTDPSGLIAITGGIGDWFRRVFCHYFPKLCAGKSGFDCTKCAGDILTEARNCYDTQYRCQSDDWDGSNSLQDKMDCINRLLKAHNNDKDIVQCIKHCASIPFSFFGKMGV